MNSANNLEKVISNPHLIRKAPTALAARWAKRIVSRQLCHKVASINTSTLSRNHYGWESITDQFSWDIFCIQQTNLINFVKTHASEKYHVAVEVGATSDMFLKHVNAEIKKGINVLAACIDQLNKQDIIGVKSCDERIPLADNEAELTICFETLEHVHNPLLFLNELTRVTRKRLLLSIPWVSKTNIKAKWYGKKDKEERPASEFHVFEFDEKDFNKLLTYTNLKKISYEKLVNYEAKYDFLTNWCIQKYLYLSYFPALQAYVLEKT